MKKVLVLGGGGFIGGHLARKLKSQGNWVRVVDLKNHEYIKHKDLCDEFVLGDLTDPNLVSRVMFSPDQHEINDPKYSFDEVYQLSADMGGARYIFTGENDANLMHNSALINLNVANYSAKFGVKKLFYSSSACMYPEYNQLDPNNPNCEESSAYPANPDSEYGWEKLFSERVYLAYHRNHGLNVRIARFHNIFGVEGTWKGGKEKSPSAICRKVASAENGSEIEIWGDGKQTRSFLDVGECVEGILRLMQSDCTKPVNIGSEEVISMNGLAEMVIKISGKDLKIKNIEGEEFYNKYGFNCPTGVRGRNSHNALIEKEVGWKPSSKLEDGITKLYNWVSEKVSNEIHSVH